MHIDTKAKIPNNTITHELNNVDHCTSRDAVRRDDTKFRWSEITRYTSKHSICVRDDDRCWI